MSKHTPEPWATEYRERHDGTFAQEIFDADGETIAILAWHPVRLDGWTKTDREENARRIVAAVNACSGFEVETLESIAMTGETLLARFELMKSENEQLKKQRDELLAALSGASEKMKAAHESMFDQCLSNPVYNAWGKEINISAINELQLEASLADAAIAKAKGGAA